LARIAGVDLPKNKKVLYGLQYIFGVGEHISAACLSKAGVNPDKKVSELTDEEVAQIRSILTSDYKVEGALRSEVQQNIKRLMDIGSYRGLRHRKGLPARGQRTRTNSRTRKGKRKTVAGKKKAPSKK
jgi:small subunit ribosomal protein S13